MCRLFFLFLCFLSINAFAKSTATCLQQLPETLEEKNTPASFQFVRASNNIRNYEEEPGGKGWGYAVKYQNSSCEVMIYLYTRQKNKITESDLETEMADFDGFEYTNALQKEIDGVSFSFAEGTLQFENNSDKQTQALALTVVQNQFLKYRASCRQITGLTQTEIFRLTESFLTKVIQKSLKKITFCLAQ